MRERELKPPFYANRPTFHPSLPMRERELKRRGEVDGFVEAKSLPMRERELKHPRRRRQRPLHPSLPMRERELKPAGLSW